MMHTIVEEGLVDEAFVRDRTSGYAELKRNVEGFSPEAMAPVCGIPAETIRTVARLFATSKASMILWGMGISQHVHGTDNARCLIALSLMTGQIGRPGTGLHPLRGQNNVQGASDAGLIPMMYPGLPARRVAAKRGRKFERLWNTQLDEKPGLTVVEIMDAVHADEIRGMYIMGENPAMSDPDVHHARAALAHLEMLVVQDIFLTETAYLADVVLPASAFPEKTGTFTNTDRLVQLGRQALEPPGDARQDLWIIQQIARRRGPRLDTTPDPREVFDEMRQAMPSIAGITWQRLEAESAVTYPCVAEGDPGDRVVFTEDFPTDTGRGAPGPGRHHPGRRAPRRRIPDGADHRPPARALAHRQHDAARPGARRDRAGAGGVDPPARSGATRRAPGRRRHRRIAARQVSLYARADDGMPRGALFIPFCYYEAAANMLTNPALDPFGKIPEFKYCAIRVRPGRAARRALHVRRRAAARRAGGGVMKGCIDADTGERTGGASGCVADSHRTSIDRRSEQLAGRTRTFLLPSALSDRRPSRSVRARTQPAGSEPAASEPSAGPLVPPALAAVKETT